MKLSRQKVIEIRKKYPCMAMQDIADQIGITRERVSQILRSEGLPSKLPRKLSHTCNQCGKEYHSYNKNSLFCSRKCYSEYKSILLFCEICGKSFRRNASRTYTNVKYKRSNGDHIFCSQECKGKWFGTNFGGLAIRQGKPSRKRSG